MAGDVVHMTSVVNWAPRELLARKLISQKERCSVPGSSVERLDLTRWLSMFSQRKSGRAHYVESGGESEISWGFFHQSEVDPSVKTKREPFLRLESVQRI